MNKGFNAVARIRGSPRAVKKIMQNTLLNVHTRMTNVNNVSPTIGVHTTTGALLRGCYFTNRHLPVAA